MIFHSSTFKRTVVTGLLAAASLALVPSFSKAAKPDNVEVACTPAKQAVAWKPMCSGLGGAVIVSP